MTYIFENYRAFVDMCYDDKGIMLCQKRFFLLSWKLSIVVHVNLDLLSNEQYVSSG